MANFNVEESETVLSRTITTPRRSISSVYAVTMRLECELRWFTGLVRCTRSDEVSAIGAALRDLAAAHSDEIVALRAAGGEPWTTWRRAHWPRLVAEADSEAEVAALSCLDAIACEALPQALRAAQATEVPASPPRVYWSGFWVADSLEELGDEARWVMANGFDAVKMRLDSRDFNRSVERYSLLAQVLPDAVPIALELVGTGSEQYVLDFYAAVDRSRILWVEDPVGPTNFAEFAAIADNGGVDVAAGETIWGVNELIAFCREAHVAVPIVDLARVGGPSGLARFLEESSDQFAAIGVHDDPLMAARVYGRVPSAARRWVEVLNWWDAATVEDVRRRYRDAVN